MKHKLIFKAIVGSQAQGTSTPESDIDIKGIYMQDIDDLISFGYEEFVQVSKDESYYELKRFLELLCTGNPNAIEILFSPEDCILQTSPQFKILYENRYLFLTKKCYSTFAGYANTQIKKSKGLDKKMNWEEQRITRKTPLDFCYVHIGGKTMELNNFLDTIGFKQEKCGLVKLNHMNNIYALYYDYTGEEHFKGIIGEDSNELRLSSISKEFAFNRNPYVLYYNKDGYASHCKDYKSYQTWIKERNTNRYHTNVSHGQVYDSKNLSHCRRLIDIAMEIGKTGTFTARRPNVEYLLQIKRGDTSLDEIIDNAEKDIEGLKEIYDNSNLPDDVDMNKVKEILLQIRKYQDPSKKIGVVGFNRNSFNNYMDNIREEGETINDVRGGSFVYKNNTYYFLEINYFESICESTFDEIIHLFTEKTIDDYPEYFKELSLHIRQ